GGCQRPALTLIHLPRPRPRRARTVTQQRVDQDRGRSLRRACLHHLRCRRTEEAVEEDDSASRVSTTMGTVASGVPVSGGTVAASTTTPGTMASDTLQHRGQPLQVLRGGIRPRPWHYVDPHRRPPPTPVLDDSSVVAV